MCSEGKRKIKRIRRRRINIKKVDENERVRVNAVQKWTAAVAEQ